MDQSNSTNEINSPSSNDDTCRELARKGELAIREQNASEGLLYKDALHHSTVIQWPIYLYLHRRNKTSRAGIIDRH